MRRITLQDGFAGKRGFALLLVISVLALIALLVLAAEGTVGSSNSLRLIYASRQARSEAAARVLAQMSQPGGSDALQVTLPAATGLPARQVTVQRRTVGAGNPVWPELPGLAAKPGDAVVTLTWSDAPGAWRVQRFLVNTAHQRQGPIQLGLTDAETRTSDQATSSSTVKKP